MVPSSPMLTWACPNAFDLRNCPDGGDANIFLVIVELTAEAESQKEKKPTKMFRVKDAGLMTKSDLAIYAGRVAKMVEVEDGRVAHTSGRRVQSHNLFL
jgi:hypothetical protein